MDTPADRLKEARIQKGLKTAVEAANRLKVKKTTYQNWEDGARSFRRNILKLAAFFNVRAEWLLDGKPPMRPPEIERRYNALTPENQAKLIDQLEMLELRQRT